MCTIARGSCGLRFWPCVPGLQLWSRPPAHGLDLSSFTPTGHLHSAVGLRLTLLSVAAVSAGTWPGPEFSVFRTYLASAQCRGTAVHAIECCRSGCSFLSRTLRLAIFERGSHHITYIYMYVYIHICIYVCVNIYIYTY